MPEWLWWAFGALAALAAGLGVVFLGRKRTPRWVKGPLLAAAALLAGLSAFQSVLGWRSNENAFTNVDCTLARPLNEEELDALRVLVLQKRASPDQLRDFVCAFVGILSRDAISVDDRAFVIEATMRAATDNDYARRQMLIDLENSPDVASALVGLADLTQTPQLRARLVEISRTLALEPGAMARFIVRPDGYFSGESNGEFGQSFVSGAARDAYPPRAREEGVEGVVVLRCTPSAFGVRCIVVSETPGGYGFGTSARALVEGLVRARDFMTFEGDISVVYRTGAPEQ